MAKYQGWTNYETWAVALWIDNEEGSYRYWRERAEELLEQGTKKKDAINELAQMMKNEHEEAAESAIEGGSLWSDLLSAALSEVNWYEVAKSRFEK